MDYYSCTICEEIFMGLSTLEKQIYSTTCGHLFHYHCLINWFATSKTCPNCREPATEGTIIRIFFDNTGLFSEIEKITHEKDNLKLQLNLKETELQELTKERNEAQMQNESLRKIIEKMGQKLVTSGQVTLAFKNEIKSLKSYCKEFNESEKLAYEELKQNFNGLIS